MIAPVDNPPPLSSLPVPPLSIPLSPPTVLTDPVPTGKLAIDDPPTKLSKLV